MTFINQSENKKPHTNSFLFSQATKPAVASRKTLAGFAKVLVNGRVVGVDHSKSFQARMIGDGVGRQTPTTPDDTGVALLEAVSANLEAGMRLLDKQELSLAKMGGKLSEIALALNQAREYVERQESAQVRFVAARDALRQLSRSTFDHTALFANGPSKPIVVAVPTLGTWEGLTIDRCDIATPGLSAVEQGKVVPTALGLLLDPPSVEMSFAEWRKLCIQNRLQWNLLSERLFQITHSLLDRARANRWQVPVFPEQSPDGPLRRPHRNN